MTFQEAILQGIPNILPEPKVFEPNINHAPKRKEILSDQEKKLHEEFIQTLGEHSIWKKINQSKNNQTSE